MQAPPCHPAPAALRTLPRRVLIAGCGDVGTATGLVLAANGVEVFGLRRNPDGLPDAISPLAGDLTDPDSLRALPEVDAVLLSAAPDGRDERAYAACYLDGPAAVLDALPSRPRRVVMTSTTAVYGQDDGSEVDEDSPTVPQRATARVVLSGEVALAERVGTDAVVLRIAGIYGPGRLRLVRQVFGGEATCGDDDPWTNRVHRDDVAAAAVTALGLPAPASHYLVVDDEPARRCEVLTWLADALGVPAPDRNVGSQRTRGGSKRCSNARLRATGWRPEHPGFRDGYAALVADFLALG